MEGTVDGVASVDASVDASSVDDVEEASVSESSAKESSSDVSTPKDVSSSAALASPRSFTGTADPSLLVTPLGAGDPAVHAQSASAGGHTATQAQEFMPSGYVDEALKLRFRADV